MFKFLSGTFSQVNSVQIFYIGHFNSIKKIVTRIFCQVVFKSFRTFARILCWKFQSAIVVLATC